MTLFEAYQLANKRRAALRVRMAPGWTLDGRTERPLRVLPRLRKGSVEVWDDDDRARTFTPVAARGLQVVRDA